MNLAQSYWELFGGLRSKALKCLLFVVVAGSLEGVALLMLIPILQGLMPGAAPSGGQFIADTLRRLPLDEDQIVYAAVGLFVFLGITAALFRLIADTNLLAFRGRLERNAREKMSRAILEIDWPSFVTLRTGDLSKSIISEGQQLNLGGYAFLDGIGATIVVLIFLTISFCVSVQLTLFALAFGIIGGGLYRLMSKRSRKFAMGLSRMQADIAERVGEIFGNLKFFRGSGRSSLAEAGAMKIYAEYEHAYFWAWAYGSILRFFFEAGAVAFVTIFLIANQLYFHQPLASTLVFLSLFYRMVPRLIRAQEAFFQSRNYVSWYHTWKQRFDFASLHREVLPGRSLPHLDRALTLEDITFVYPSASEPALNRVSLSIQRGDCVALVGPSGSGKSTLVDVILGLVHPTSGRIALDGLSLGEIDINSWRQSIGLVTQDCPVFYGTVAENIAWAEQSPDLARIERAARLANAWSFIQELPNGAQTLIGERGGKLSGGQRQRIAIARALYREPKLLVLDEATSALDGESESLIQSALTELKGVYTILIVAHRLKTVKIADHIAVLDKGRVIEQGTWEQLVRTDGGHFHRMVHLQDIDSASLVRKAS